MENKKEIILTMTVDEAESLFHEIGNCDVQCTKQKMISRLEELLVECLNLGET